MARSSLFIRNFRCVRALKFIHRRTEKEQSNSHTRARVSNKMRELLFWERRCAARPSSVWICASVEIVRAALLRPWIFDYSFRLTKHREPVFEKQSFCLERRARGFSTKQTALWLVRRSVGRCRWCARMEANNEIVFRFISRESAERWTQLIWYCRAVITLRHVTTTAN